jgi:hypothetical protein
MQVSLRIPRETGDRLQALAAKTGKTKTALILEALDEKYAPKKNRSQLIRDLAGWMPETECDALRHAVSDFSVIDEKEWP